MGLHILAIGRPNTTGTGPMTNVVDRARDRVHGLGSLVLARCRDESDLLKAVAHHGRSESRIDILDIFDHGGPGVQNLGGDVLFSSDGSRSSKLVGESAAINMRPHLSDVAQIRLLGCLTTGGDGVKGRFLLLKLARALGGNRVVFGTIEKIDHKSFGPDGFPPEMNDSFLFSSFAALDGLAPDSGTRVDHINETRP